MPHPAQSYSFVLNTPDRIVTALDGIRQDNLVRDDIDDDLAYIELRIASEILKQIESATQVNPSLLTDHVLDAYKNLAMNSPHQDIDIPGAPLHHRQSPAQELALAAARSLAFTEMRLPQLGNRVISRLENLAMECKDWDLRNEAVYLLWMNASTGQELRPVAVAALQNISRNNSNSVIRTMARDRLTGLAQDINAATPIAMLAHSEGAADADPKARADALAMLNNRVQSPSCPAAEVKQLQRLFAKAADRDPIITPAGYWAREGLLASGDRLRTGKAGGFLFPYNPRP